MQKKIKNKKKIKKTKILNGTNKGTMCRKEKDHTHLGIKTQRRQGQRPGQNGNKWEK
jgi:hypothetical protein